MKLIPDFFFRSATRLLLFQALVAWLYMRGDYLHLPLLLKVALTGAFGSVLGDSKSILDLHAGFDLPWEATFFLPILLDGYIKKSMPELATLLGMSPCSHKYVTSHGKTKGCALSLAHDCFQYGAQMEYGKKSFEIMDACYEEFGISATEAAEHHDRCREVDPNGFMGLAACMRSRMYLEESKETSATAPSFLECTMMYAAWDLITPMMQKEGMQVKMHGSLDVCLKRTSLPKKRVFSSPESSRK